MDFRGFLFARMETGGDDDLSRREKEDVLRRVTDTARVLRDKIASLNESIELAQNEEALEQILPLQEVGLFLSPPSLSFSILFLLFFSSFLFLFFSC